jgi:hypothetical protein
LALAGYSRQQLDDVNPHSMDLVKAIQEGANYARSRGWAVCTFRNSGYGPGGKHFDPPVHATMFHNGRYKLSFYHDLTLSGSPMGELYDIQADPGETRNLWASDRHAGIKARLLSRTIDWMFESDVRHWGSRGGEKFRQSVMKEYSE